MAKKIPLDDITGLEPVVFLAKGARAMLTMNLWSSVGLCNGVTGTVVNIIDQDNHRPPDLPIAVVVEFEKTTEDPVLIATNRCVPNISINKIMIINCHITEIGFHERRQ